MSEKGTRRRPLELLSAYLPAALSVLLGACLSSRCTFRCLVRLPVHQLLGWPVAFADRPFVGSGYFHRGSEVVFPLLCADLAREGTGLQPSG